MIAVFTGVQAMLRSTVAIILLATAAVSRRGQSRNDGRTLAVAGARGARPRGRRERRRRGAPRRRRRATQALRQDLSAPADDDARAALRGRKFCRDAAGRSREQPPAARTGSRRLRIRRQQHDRDRRRRRQCLRQPRPDDHADPGRSGDPAAVHPVSPAAAQPAAAPGARPHQFAALSRRRPVRRAAATRS